jgi:uncharacterized protein YpiB (UPF0302 family)
MFLYNLSIDKDFIKMIQVWGGTQYKIKIQMCFKILNYFKHQTQSISLKGKTEKKHNTYSIGGLILSTYKELLHVAKKKTNNPIEK